MDIQVVDDPEKQRYEVSVDGELAGFAEYRLSKDVISFTHAEVASAFEGRGLASILVRRALDDARRRGLAVKPFCPFVRGYIVRNPEYLDLVPEGQRERFELPGNA